MSVPFLFSFSPELQKENPQYYDVAIGIHKIKQILHHYIGGSIHVFDVGDIEEDIDSILEEDIQDHPDQVHTLAGVFDCLETYTINSKQNNNSQLYEVKPTLNNHVYYYPSFQVGYCNIPIYQMHADYPCTYIFAANKQAVDNFMNYIYTRQRQVMKNYINIFVDTEDGVERKKEAVKHIVHKDDVFLEEGLKSEIFRFIEQFFEEDGKFYRTYSIPYKRGILLYGKPGNGKTTLVKSIAATVSAPVIYWQITEFTSSYTIDEVFSSVSLFSPCILIIEDIDSMPDAVRSYFLNTLDGAVSREGCFLIGTTNYPEKIDPALINRAGRFDRAYEFHLPNEEMRKKYLQKKGLIQIVSEQEFVEIIKMTSDFSFAQLNELYIQIALVWHYDKATPTKDIIQRLKKDVKKGLEQTWGIEKSNRLGFYHE